MGLDKPNQVDAGGVDKVTNELILTIADSWGWTNEKEHLVALQEKINNYFSFIESKQIVDSHPDAFSHPLVIEVVGQYPLSDVGRKLIQQANTVGEGLNVQVRFRTFRQDDKIHS